VQRLNIFICYRREDTADGAVRLGYELREALANNAKIFIDIDDIPIGIDFVAHLNAEVARCDVLLAVIGPRWLELESEKYRRAVDDPEDYVRIEIVAALKRKIPVVPILLNGAKVPRAEQLPADLKDLSSRNGIEVRHAAFPSDVARLVRELMTPAKGREPPPKVTVASLPRPASPFARALADAPPRPKIDVQVPKGPTHDWRKGVGTVQALIEWAIVIAIFAGIAVGIYYLFQSWHTWCHTWNIFFRKLLSC